MGVDPATQRAARFASLLPQILRKYIYGGHVGEYMEEMIEEDPEKYQASNRLLIAHVSSRLCPSPGLRPSLTAP